MLKRILEAIARYSFIVLFVLIVTMDRSEIRTIPLEMNITGSEYRGAWNISTPVSKAELNCMALNVYFEARNEPLAGQYAVAEVVMNRVMHHNYPNTICGVIKAGIYSSWDVKKAMPLKNRCAFSWYCDRKPDVVVNGEAFEVAKEVANDVVTNPSYVPILGPSLFYHADYVDPYWAKEMTPKKVISRHIFY